jgi:hypothetical protein
LYTLHCELPGQFTPQATMVQAPPGQLVMHMPPPAVTPGHWLSLVQGSPIAPTEPEEPLEDPEPDELEPLLEPPPLDEPDAPEDDPEDVELPDDPEEPPDVAASGPASVSLVAGPDEDALHPSAAKSERANPTSPRFRMCAMLAPEVGASTRCCACKRPGRAPITPEREA